MRQSSRQNLVAQHPEAEDICGGRGSPDALRELGSHVHNLAIASGSESRVKTKDGKDSVETLIWTDTWLKRNGRWQIIAAVDLVPAK